MKDKSGSSNVGAAYVFVPSGSTWTQQAKLTQPDGVSNDLFGSAVALEGNTAIITAEGDNGRGTAHAFQRTGTSWSYVQLVAPNSPDSHAGQRFGASVALSGDTLAIGASSENTSVGTFAGAVYVFTKVGTFWSQSQRLTPPDAAALDQFGSTVALDGNVLVVGSPGKGAAYVFRKAGSAWVHEQTLIGDVTGPGGSFGSAVAVSGTKTFVGAPSEDHPGDSDRGFAYGFSWNGSTWNRVAKLQNSISTDDFAGSLALDGNNAVIEANQFGGIGRSIYFKWTGSSWVQSATLTQGLNSSPIRAIGVSGNLAVHGLPFDDTQASNAGAAVIFNLAP